MKKISLKLTVLIGVVLMLSFGVVFTWKPVLSTEVSSAVNSSEYEEFADAVNSIIKEYPVTENGIVFLDKKRDLTQDADGNFWVTEQVFENSIDDNKSTSYETNLKLLSNEVPMYELTELAAENNYQVTVDESSVVLTRKFASRRLIISATTPINDFYGAVGVTNYNNLYILQYATEEETKDAYSFYLKQTGLDVWTDDYCWVDDTECETQSIMPLGLGDSFSYKTWGAEAMHVDDYSQYLNNLVNAQNTSYTELPEVVVAVLDTGIDTDHPWFTDRFLRDENGEIIGKDYTGVNETVYEFEDDQGHGTHCAGIICDMTLPNVKILPIKFMYMHDDGKCYGSTSSALLGIIYSIELSKTKNIVSINMSFGSENSNVYDSEINSAYENGIFSVASAGNDNINCDAHQPSSINKAIAVSAVDKNNAKASFSNFGETVDVCAPGVSINSASITGSTTYMSGTSMAAPHIAAYIALLKSDPSKNYTMTDIENILCGKFNDINTIYDLGDSGKDIYFGYGLPHLDGLTPETSYKVNHYLEPLYDLNNQSTIPQYSEYTLQEIENVDGKLFSLTNATPKKYAGFTPINFEQQTITDDNTVINIYYKRNQYNFSIEDPGEGLENIVGPGKYLYGDVVTMSSSLMIPYDEIIWKVNNNDTIENFSYNLLNQSFIMPAMDVNLTAQLKFKKFLLNVKAYGKGEVSPNSRMVNYGDNVEFEFTPEVDCKVNTIYLNGAEIKLDGLKFTLENITSYVELVVYFTKIIDDNLLNDVIESTTESTDEKLEDDFNNYTISSDNNYLNLAVVGGICCVSVAVLICIVGVLLLRR